MNPTYHSLGNHTEAIQIDFNPDEIDFATILNLIWTSHNPIGAKRSSQYKSAIWFGDDHQKTAIEQSIQPLEEKYDCALTTEILPLETFFNAEDYHQKYVLQRHDAVMKQFKTFYADFDEFVNSTAAARLNGFAYGCGSKTLFEAEQSEYGIAQEILAPVLRV
jgi:peptide-methionine (S)-S-oxide reductase